MTSNVKIMPELEGTAGCIPDEAKIRGLIC
jgi:hypothetical protein